MEIYVRQKTKNIYAFGGHVRQIIKPQLETIRNNLKESKESLQQSRKESPISLWFSYGNDRD